MTDKATWQIAIDTGGTFTDCIGQDPQGGILRTKVLSNSCLRGTLITRLGPAHFHFSHNWTVTKDIFRGYALSLTAEPGSAPSRILVKSIDFLNSTITLEADLRPESLPAVFDITAGEEPPILAARLITATPLHEPLPPMEMRLGTTRGTNALLEQKTATTALIITKGFGDLPSIGTQQRPHLFQLDIPAPAKYCTLVFEVRERLDARGRVLTALSNREINRIVRLVRESGVQSVAIALMHAWKNPAHELTIREALLQSGGPRFISLSHELMPAIRLLPRSLTTLVNASLAPILRDYLDNIAHSLGIQEQGNPSGSSLKVMGSAGGLVPAASFLPKDSLLSGPAGGVIGTAAIARQLGFNKVIAFDMGGTSTDAARCEAGRPDYEHTTRVGSIEMLSPSLAIETVAAGGGSICHFDGHKLCVGPESAGALPGPACYGAGGSLTLTDVNLLLGKLDPQAMGIPVNAGLARKALRDIQTAIHGKTGVQYSERELLAGFESIADEKMAEAIRKISIAKGFDPREYALLAFGGAGGLHACSLAGLLGIDTVILPRDAGLLSAYGISQAAVEQTAHRQILQRLAECEQKLPALARDLMAEAASSPALAGYAAEEVQLLSCRLYLRFEAQESCLELDFNQAATDSLASIFEKTYRQRYGHFPESRHIEVESIKVVVAAGRDAGAAEVGLRQSRPAHGPALASDSPLRWDELPPGATAIGPAILLNPHATAYLAEGWQMEVAPGAHLILKRQPDHGPQVSPEISPLPQDKANPIELELFTNRFAGIAREMGVRLQHSAFSVNIKERLDFSCALLDNQARLLVNAPHIPVHLGSLGVCARLAMERLPPEPGDVIITNHPMYGGSHLPDVTLIAPVHEAGPSGRLIGYVVNRAHHAEIGGKTPGSMPPDARNLAEEGVVIPPVLLVKNNTPQWEHISALLSGAPWPTRSLPENLADIEAALASLRTGAEKLRLLALEHGLEKIQLYMEALRRHASDSLFSTLRPFEGREFAATEKMDDGSPLCVRIRIEKSGLEMDFTGTAGAHPYNLNANVSIVYSTVMYVLRLLCGKDLPMNEGLMANVVVRLPTGSFLHPGFSEDPLHCPAVVGGNTEVSQRLADTLLKAMAPLARTACSQGTMNNFLFGNEKFGYYETIGGGAGAGEGYHGRSAVHQHMTNTRITDPEELEFRYPVLLRRFAIRRGSGGRGQWQGGDGIVREIEFLEPVDMTIMAQHRREAPYGLAGGKPGKRGRQYLVSKKGMESIEGQHNCQMAPGDSIIIETPGGGGYGPPG
jgi:5-oxoprolinase (ATP-hydrolysing)